MRWSAGVATRGDRKEAQKKMKFIISTDLQAGGRVTWERHQKGQEAKDRIKETALAKAFIGVFTGKARQSKVNSLGWDSWNNFGGL